MLQWKKILKYVLLINTSFISQYCEKTTKGSFFPMLYHKLDFMTILLGTAEATIYMGMLKLRQLAQYHFTKWVKSVLSTAICTYYSSHATCPMVPHKVGHITHTTCPMVSQKVESNLYCLHNSQTYPMLHYKI